MTMFSHPRTQRSQLEAQDIVAQKQGAKNVSTEIQEIAEEEHAEEQVEVPGDFSKDPGLDFTTCGG